MGKLTLDEPCKKILSILLLLDKGIRFNTLHKLLNEHGNPISKPTLIGHLKHLTRKKVVIRRKLGRQIVTYEINETTLRRVCKVGDITRDLVKHFYDNEQRCKSLPIGDQIEYIHGLMMLEQLMLMKLELLDIFNPKDRFDTSLSHFLTIQHFGIFRNWLLNNIRLNPEKYKEEANKTLQNLTDRYMTVIFEPPKK